MEGRCGIPGYTPAARGPLPPTAYPQERDNACRHKTAGALTDGLYVCVCMYVHMSDTHRQSVSHVLAH